MMIFKVWKQKSKCKWIVNIWFSNRWYLWTKNKFLHHPKCSIGKQSIRGKVKLVAACNTNSNSKTIALNLSWYFIYWHCVKCFPIQSFSGPYSMKILENTDQENSEYGHFSRSVMLQKLNSKSELFKNKKYLTQRWESGKW